MSSNTICLRIFYILFLLIVGGGMILVHWGMLLTPLAVSMLATEKADATYSSGGVLVLSQIDSNQQIYLSRINYGGHYGELRSRMPPTPLKSRDEITRDLTNLFVSRAGSEPPAPEPEPTFPVLFVRSFPSMVVRDLPGASLWTYYADTWTTRDFLGFFIPMCLVITVAVFFWRHLRASRRRHAWR